MKLLPALSVLFACATGIFSQQVEPKFSLTSPTAWAAQWVGQPHHIYFPQWSTDLTNWTYIPTIEFGEATHTIGGNVSGSTYFVRLAYYSDPTISDLAAAKAADKDQDSLSNWTELTSSNTNPYDSDSDGDSLPDGWEVAHGINPNDNGSGSISNGASGSFQGGSQTNGQAYAEDVQANPNANFADKDGDGLTNDIDSAPTDREINWKKLLSPTTSGSHR